jgi:dihydroorotate dehydrogenase (fumarate)/dihydroorotate dehydrogenase (NAD+) catalytic subunit
MPPAKERTRLFAGGAFNSTRYSHRHIDAWQSDVQQLSEEGLPVICSIFADSPAALSRLAEGLADAGCRAFELGPACPTDGSQQGLDAKTVRRLTEAVRKTTSLPLAVKLNAVGSLRDLVSAALDGGAAAISLSDALPAIVVNSRKRKLAFDGPVGYSGPAIKPIVLHAIYELRCQGVTCPIIGIGGVTEATDVIEYLQAGATAIQVYTAIMRGFSTITEMVQGLTEWCETEETTVRAVGGAALRGTL